MAGKASDGGIVRLRDDELDLVAGGYDIVFDDSLGHDSWFVSYLTRRMLRDGIEQQLSRGNGVLAGDISIQGRRFKLTQFGDQILVQPAP